MFCGDGDNFHRKLVQIKSTELRAGARHGETLFFESSITAGLNGDALLLPVAAGNVFTPYRFSARKERTH